MLLAAACDGGQGGALGDDALDTESVHRLLVPADVERAGGSGDFGVETEDLGAIAGQVGASQVEGVDAWVGLSLRTAGGALLLQVIEFDDAARAAARMDQTRGGQGFTPMTGDNVIGDASLLSESGGSAGPGVLFVKGRRFVSLQAVGATADAAQVVDAAQLVEVAGVVAGRL